MLQSGKWEVTGSHGLSSCGCVMGHFVQLRGTSLRTNIEGPAQWMHSSLHPVNVTDTGTVSPARLIQAKADTCCWTTKALFCFVPLSSDEL